MTENLDNMIVQTSSKDKEITSEIPAENLPVAESSSEPVYETGIEMESLAEESSKEQENASPKKENAAIRRRIEKAEAKARAEKELEIEALKQRQAELEQIVINAYSNREAPIQEDVDPETAVTRLMENAYYNIQKKEREKEEELNIQQKYHQQLSAQKQEEVLHNQYCQELLNSRDRFPDFDELVDKVKMGEFINEAMLSSLRRADDPAALTYNLLKHHAADLKYIFSIPDPIDQIEEMAKLKSKITAKITPRTHSNAPTPISGTRAAMTTPNDDDMLSWDYMNRAEKDRKKSEWR